MIELKTLLAENYENHSAFFAANEEWEIDSDKLKIFNQRYEMARRIGATLDKKSFSSLSQDCCSLLNDIFRSMESQCSDAFEKQFLNELNAECARLLADELCWYSRKKRHKFVNLQEVNTRKNTVALANERHYFGCLRQSAVDEIMGLASLDLIELRKNASEGKLTREELSVNGGRSIRGIIRILNREYKKNGVLASLNAYTGRKMRVTGLALELSVPQATWWKNSMPELGASPSTLYAHFDETVFNPKSIVYLSNVTEKTGPTSCYPGAYEKMRLEPLQEIIGRVVGVVGSRADSPLKGYYAKQYHQSMSSEMFRRHFMKLPEKLRFNSHMGWDVLPGSELEKELASVESKMTGPAGTYIIFDGARLLHRGGLMQEGERVVLQVIFSDKSLAQLVAGKIKRLFL